jgi:hypothetical protein
MARRALRRATAQGLRRCLAGGDGETVTQHGEQQWWQRWMMHVVAAAVIVGLLSAFARAPDRGA